MRTPPVPRPVYPDLSSREMEVEASYINGVLGLQLAPGAISELLRRCRRSQADAICDGCGRRPGCRCRGLWPV